MLVSIFSRIDSFSWFKSVLILINRSSYIWPLGYLWHLLKVTVHGFWQSLVKATWILPFWSMLRFLMNSFALVVLETVILFTVLWAIANTSLTRIDDWPTFQRQDAVKIGWISFNNFIIVYNLTVFITFADTIE